MGTSLPELATSFVAGLRQEVDLVVGNAEKIQAAASAEQADPMRVRVNDNMTVRETTEAA